MDNERALQLLRGQPWAGLERGVRIVGRGGNGEGQTTGGIRGCRCEAGVRVGVRWADGALTWVCTKGLTVGPEPGTFQIV